MKFLFVADLHYTLKQFDWLLARASEFDGIVIGGDLLDLSSALDISVQITVVEKYLDRLQAKTRLIVSSGNHDGDGRNTADESVSRWIRDIRNSGIGVDGASVEWDGTLFTVCPWWDGPVSRAELELQLERDARRTPKNWIWVHHAPPSGSPLAWTGRKFVGDEYLRGWIERFQPDLVLSGHIHNAPFVNQGAWVDRIGKTRAFNPGRQIGPAPTCIAFDLASGAAEWTSLAGISITQFAVPDGLIPGANDFPIRTI